MIINCCSEREKKAAPKPTTATASPDATIKNIDDEKLKAISSALATMAKPSSVELERQSLAELKKDVIEHIEEVTLDQAMEEALLEHAARIKLERERLAKEKKERDEAEAKRAAEKVTIELLDIISVANIYPLFRLLKSKRDSLKNNQPSLLNRNSQLNRRSLPRSNKRNKPLPLRLQRQLLMLRLKPLKLPRSLLNLPRRPKRRRLRRRRLKKRRKLKRRRLLLRLRSRNSPMKRSDRLLNWRRLKPRSRNCESKSRAVILIDVIYTVLTR